MDDGCYKDMSFEFAVKVQLLQIVMLIHNLSFNRD